jgi:hypothetical protein
MSTPRQPDQPAISEAMSRRAIRLRLFAAGLAIVAGVAALTVAILLVRSVLG